MPYYDEMLPEEVAVKDAVLYWQERAEKAEAWAKAWKSSARGYHDKANICICSYCGHESQKDRREILEHMLECEKRPDKQLWQALATAADDMKRLEADNAALRARVEELEQQVFLLTPTIEDVRITGSDHTTYDGEGIA